MNFLKSFVIFSFFLVFLCSLSVQVNAQEMVPDTITVSKAVVLEISDSEIRNVPGLDIKTTYQKISAEILDGPEKGKVISIENDYLSLEVGEKFYVRHTVNVFDNIDTYVVMDPYRLPVLYFFIGFFVLMVIVFGGKQGIRGLIALCGSFLFIFYLLLPGVLNGYSPVLVSMGVSSLIIIIGSYVTHGFNRVTSSAVLGMVITIVITGIMAFLAISYGRLTGFASEETVYLNLNTGGSIDFAGLLLGGILIGLLGVLYDAAIGQSVSVDELHRAGPHLSKSYIFKRAIRIGREHIGALVNTLAIAYVGASLPLLLLFYQSTASYSMMINQEIFATEIIRTMIGSIGLVLAVPITTIISIFLIVGKSKYGPADDRLIDAEKKMAEHIGHGH